MEFVNIRYITMNNESLFNKGCDKVLDYDKLKDLSPVTINDLLQLNPQTDNVQLFEHYRSEGMLLIPIRRRPQVVREYCNNFPRRILLELTSQCNLKCSMCPRNVLTRPETHMSKELAMHCIDEIDKQGVDGLWLYNIGESLLHPDFNEIFEYCQTKNNLGSLWLSTNGQAITESQINMLINSNLTFLNFSLNAMSADAYKDVSSGGDYKRLVNNLKAILVKKRNTKTMGKPPWIRIQMIEQLKVQAEIDCFLKTYGPVTEFLSINRLAAFSQDVSQNIEYAQKRIRRQRTHCNRIQRGDCFIFSDGEVAFCDTDFNHQMAIGNVKDASIEQIWKGQAHQNYTLLNNEGRLEELELCSQCLDYDL